jgi:hypothetical protein
MAELDKLEQLLTDHLPGQAEKLVAELDRLRRAMVVYLRSEEREDDWTRNREESRTPRPGHHGFEP